jgi:hypothetical protein
MRRSILIVLLCVAGLLQGAPSCSPGTFSAGACSQHPTTYTVPCTVPVGSANSVQTLADLQSAVDDAHRGDTITIPAACRIITNNPSDAPALKIRRDPPGSSGRVVITSSEHAKLPADGTRITPAYWPLVPQFVLTGGQGPIVKIYSGSEYTATDAGVSASHWEFRGVGFIAEVTNPVGLSSTNSLVEVGAGGEAFSVADTTYPFTALTVSGGVATGTTSTSADRRMREGTKIRISGVTGDDALNGVKTILAGPTTTSFTFDATGVADGTYTVASMWYTRLSDNTQLPDDIVFDRTLFLNNGLHTNLLRDIYFHAKNSVVKNSWLTAAKVVGSDSQHILMINAGDSNTIENNYIGGAGTEQVMFGGGALFLPEFPSNTLIRYNLFTRTPKRERVRTWSLMRNTDGDTSAFKGRMTRNTSGTAVYFIAMNSGNLGSVEPTWCGTASCEVTESGVSNPVVWRRYGTSTYTLKNLIEFKRAHSTTVTHNVFDTSWIAAQIYAMVITASCESIYPDYENDCAPSITGATVNVNGATVTKVSGEFPYMANAHTVEAMTVDTATDTITFVNTPGIGSGTMQGLDLDQAVIFFGSSLPAPLAEQTIYWTTATSGANAPTWIRVSATKGGATLDLTTAGSGTMVAAAADTVGNIIKINGTYYQVSSFDSPTQLTLTASAGLATGDYSMSHGSDITRRLCQAGQTRDTAITHNIIRNVPMPITILPGTVNAGMQNSYNVNFSHNLLTGVEPNKWLNTTNGGLSVQAMMFFSPHVPGMKINHNTMIHGPVGGINYFLYPEDIGPSDSIITNNIINKVGNANPIRSAWSDVTSKMCGGVACPASQYGNNVFAGGTISSYLSVNPSNRNTPGSTHNLCATGASCTIATGLDYSLVFRDYDAGKYDVPSTSTFKRAGSDGADYGADHAMLPSINNLKVTPTDRMALFTYTVSRPISGVPCALEVATDEEISAYAGEMGTVATYYGRDSDGYDGFPRPTPMQRMIVAGASANLTASTLYYYRLHCGGDWATGTFTTTAAKSGTTTLNVKRTTAAAMEWGYTYSRTADEDGNPGTDPFSGGGSGSCASNTCTATVDRGKVVYYRIGASGPVERRVIR